jgi:hypothetical protein
MFVEGVRFHWLKRRRSRSKHGGPTRLDAARLSGLIGTARLGDADRPSKRWRSFWRKRNVTRAKRNGSDSFAVQRLWSSYRSSGTSRNERKVLFGMQRRCRDDDLAENRNQRRLARRPALRITRRRARAIEPAIGSPSPIRINIRRGCDIQPAISNLADHQAPAANSSICDSNNPSLRITHS